jgi:hypothetical protein
MCMLCFSLGLRLIVLVDWQLNQSFIAKNLCEKRNEVNSCCQGKCQLKKRMDKLENDYQPPSDGKKKPESEKSFDFFDLPLDIQSMYSASCHSKVLFGERLESDYRYLFAADSFKPPSTI